MPLNLLLRIEGLIFRMGMGRPGVTLFGNERAISLDRHARKVPWIRIHDSHIFSMTNEKQDSPKLHAVDAIKAERDAVLIAVGIDPETVVWPDPSEPAEEERAEAELEGCLSDEAWRAVAPLLPAEAPQARAMGNRQFLDEVLRAMQRRGVWTTRQRTAAETEAVRRRFGRWAHLGVFQDLAEKLEPVDLPSELKDALALAAKRADSLRRRASGRGKR
jgi:Putative transposase of IS4/5 family (DUF4096)